MILHTVNKSPFSHSCFAECIALCSANSAVLLIEDGVYAAQIGSPSADTIGQRSDISFYILAADVSARGLDNKLCANISLVDDTGFVELVTRYHSVQSWY